MIAILQCKLRNVALAPPPLSSPPTPMWHTPTNLAAISADNREVINAVILQHTPLVTAT